MKKLFYLLACSIMIMAAACSQGASAVNKAYEQAQKGENPEKVATTLCNGQIDCSALSTDEVNKLGACIGYVTATGLFSSNFQDQVDMHQFGDLLEGYRKVEMNQTDAQKEQIMEMTKQLLNPAP